VKLSRQQIVWLVILSALALIAIAYLKREAVEIVEVEQYEP